MSQPLPPGWREAYDPETGRNYYIFLKTGKTTWDDPRKRQYQAPVPAVQAYSPVNGEQSQPYPQKYPQTSPVYPSQGPSPSHTTSQPQFIPSPQPMHLSASHSSSSPSAGTTPPPPYSSISPQQNIAPNPHSYSYPPSSSQSCQQQQSQPVHFVVPQPSQNQPSQSQSHYAQYPPSSYPPQQPQQAQPYQPPVQPQYNYSQNMPVNNQQYPYPQQYPQPYATYPANQTNRIPNYGGGAYNVQQQNGNYPPRKQHSTNGQTYPGGGGGRGGYVKKPRRLSSLQIDQYEAEEEQKKFLSNLALVQEGTESEKQAYYISLGQAMKEADDECIAEFKVEPLKVNKRASMSPPGRNAASSKGPVENPARRTSLTDTINAEIDAEIANFQALTISNQAISEESRQNNVPDGPPPQLSGLPPEERQKQQRLEQQRLYAEDEQRASANQMTFNAPIYPPQNASQISSNTRVV